MPAKLLRLRCRHIYVAFAVVLCVPINMKAQTGRVTMTGTISQTIALSASANLPSANVNTDVMSTGNTVRVVLSGNDAGAQVIRVPLLVRSNTGFKISAVVDSGTAALTQLSIVDVRATGSLVSPQAINGLSVPQPFDLRGRDETSSTQNPLDVSRPVLVVSGPRVSLGGTLDSPNNALQVTVLIRLEPQPARPWLVQLTFVGSAVSLIQ